MADKKYLIVGIDPGTTVGVALLGLDGEVLAIHSSRTLNLKDLIHLMIGQGYPLIVATDVSPVPAFVEKVCHLFEAVLHTPRHSLTVEEKREIIRTFSTKFSVDLVFRNSHEKDAFAAAVKALESYEDKFRWIDKKLVEKDLSNLSEQIKASVVSGNRLSDSLAEVLGKGKPVKRTCKPPPTKGVPREIDESKLRRSLRIEDSIIKNMKSEVIELKTKLKERELETKSLGNELENVHSEEFWAIVRSKEIDSRNKMILELKRSLSRVAADRDKLRKKIASLSGSSIWKVAERIETITVVKDLSKRTIAELEKSKPPDDLRFLLVKDASGTGVSVSRTLGEMKVEAVFIESEIPTPARESLESSGILVIPKKTLDLVVIDGMALAEKNGLGKILSRERKKLARRTTNKATVGLERLVEGYRRRVTSERTHGV